MVISLRQAIGGVQRNANGIAGAGKSLSLIVEQTDEAAHQINDAIDQVAQGSQAQSHGLEDANRMIQEEVNAIKALPQASNSSPGWWRRRAVYSMISYPTPFARWKAA
ncbi:MAG: hypothetical protein R2856_03310 [Caldilineaceae bacterium]